MSINNTIDLHEDTQENSWIVTYADLVTLLLVFFILLFSVSTIEEDSFAETIDSVKSALKGTGTGSRAGAGAGSKDDKDSTKVETGTVPTDSLDPSIETGEDQQAPTEEQAPIITTPFAVVASESEAIKAGRQNKQDMARVNQAVNELVASTAGGKNAKVSSLDNRKIVINVRGDLFFNAGSAQFKREAMPIMDGIGNILRNKGQYDLSIGGHTDNTPISTNRYPSNWELSAIRATTVLRYFVRGGLSPDRLKATGYGESAPLAANNTEQQRIENRRIEFVLERTTP